MKRKLSALSRRYASALRKHLKQGPQTGFESARGLGRQAARLGLETLDVARIHAGVVAVLELHASRDGLIKRAEDFFAETITPIEKTHQAALKAGVRICQVSRKLNRRTMDLAASKRSLQQSIARRKTAQKALKKSGGHSNKLLEESGRLQNHLRYLTHQILAAQENKRKKLSLNLQDEIAQTLLGINVRLLTLKTDAAASAQSFKKDIARTQRLVDKAGARMKQFAREIG